jgi:hypothetical protein
MSNSVSAEIIPFPTRPAKVVWSDVSAQELLDINPVWPSATRSDAPAGSEATAGSDAATAGVDVLADVKPLTGVEAPMGADAPAGVDASGNVEAPASAGGTQERLARALLALDAAMTEQRTAVAAWRHALSDLSTTMRGLSSSVQRYRGSLASLDAKVAGLRHEADRLERWADDALIDAGQSTPAGR